MEKMIISGRIIRNNLLSIAIFLVVTRAFIEVNLLYYLFPILCATLIFFSIKYFKGLNKNLIYVSLFPLYCLLSSIWSLDSYWSLKRSIYLIIIFWGLLVLLIVYNQSKDFFKSFLPANLFILGLSLFSLIFQIPADRWTGGNSMGFKGFSLHQNTLASLIVFTLPGLFFILQKSNKKSYSNLLFISLMLINIFILLITYSRASILAFFITLLFYILLKDFSYLKYILTGILFLVFLYFLPSKFHDTINTLALKNGNNIFDRRLELWEASFKAAKLGGLFGLGYGISSPQINISQGNFRDDGKYIREKGNSILGLIEEVGILGFLFFITPLLLIVKNIILLYKKKENLLIIATILGMIIHAQFEAWWVGPGSVQYPLYLTYTNYLIFNNTIS